MVDLSGRDIPRLAASLQLSAQSASLASQGPALLVSQNDDALNERIKKMDEIQKGTQEKLGEIIELGADKTIVAALSETVKNIDDTIKSLVSAARERLEAAAQHDKQYDALRAAQAAFVAAAGPAMMDAQVEINAILTVSRTFRRRRDARPRGPSSSSAMSSPAATSPPSDMIGCALGQQQRHAGCDREGIQGGAGARQIEPRFAAQERRRPRR